MKKKELRGHLGTLAFILPDGSQLIISPDEE